MLAENTEDGSVSPQADAVGSAALTRRRRPPNLAEQARRKAWGAEWGKVGAAYKRRNERTEKP